MDLTELQQWIDQNTLLAFGGVVILSVILFFIARGIIARGLIYLATRTESKYDDIVVKNLRPFRVAWLVPMAVLYASADMVPDYRDLIEKSTLFLILWVSTFTLNALLSALNEIYESSPSFTGVSIQGYLDLVKILVFLIAVILSISLLTGESPLVLLSGLGAVTAVLLLIFRDTILSLVASVQIAAHDLVKEGDWLEVPSYGADGDVINISLHTIKVQNFDKTITVIPTYKMVEVAFKNWRGMQESGGRRIKRSIFIDLGSIKFCDETMIDRFRGIDLIRDFVDTMLQKEASDTEGQDGGLVSSMGAHQFTNVGVFRAYAAAFLRSRPELHRDGMTLLVRELAPSTTGLPLELYVFTKTTAWAEYEAVQAEIIDHLLAAASYFDLRVFQEPSGIDLASLAETRA